MQETSKYKQEPMGKAGQILLEQQVGADAR